MKIQDVKPVNEDLANVIGDYGASQVRQLGSKIKGMFGKGDGFSAMSGEQRQVMDMFIRDLVGDASGALTQAIATGLVNPNSPVQQRAEPTIPQDQNISQKPTGTSVDTSQIKQRSATASQAAQTDTQTVAQQIQATQVANATKAKQDAEIKAAKDAAMAKPGHQRTATDKLAILKAQRMGIRESQKSTLTNTNNKFYKLNRIFETILGEAMTVADFLERRWLPAYARKQNINYNSDIEDIKRVIKQIGQEYSTNRGKTSLPKLGQLLYAIRQSQPITPSAPPPPAAAVSQPTQAQPSTSDRYNMVTKIEQDLKKLQATDAAMYQKLIQKLTGNT